MGGFLIVRGYWAAKPYSNCEGPHNISERVSRAVGVPGACGAEVMAGRI